MTGASYGGYLTLQALSKAPDLWAGGMAEVAFADHSRKESAPLNYTQEIKAPLLVIQGKYDSRCPPQQMRDYERELMSLGKEIQIHWFDNGHFQSDVELEIQHQEVMLRFAYRAINKSLSIFTEAIDTARTTKRARIGTHTALR